MPTDPAVM